MWTRLIIISTLGAAAGVILLGIVPVNSTMLKLGILGCIAATWTGLVIILWGRRSVRVLLMALPLVAAIPVSLPGRVIDTEELRQDYVRRLSGFEGAPYHWGGESSRGIDCSGLPRKAYRDALLSYGFRHGNGRAIRSCLEQWWFDASAKALKEGYRNNTVPLSTAGNIRVMPYDALIPGDLAVTESGVHMLAYVGEGRWIQADPSFGKVITLDGRTGESAWFRQPVTTHRWTLLVSDDIR